MSLFRLAKIKLDLDIFDQPNPTFAMSCGCDLDLKLTLAVGMSPIWGFTCTDPDNAGAAINISGATFEHFVKETATDADANAVYSLTSADDEIVIISASAGTVQIFNDATKSALLEIGRTYDWSLRATFTSGETRVIRRGKLFAEAP